jgi:hypothetical protein
MPRMVPCVSGSPKSLIRENREVVRATTMEDSRHEDVAYEK